MAKDVELDFDDNWDSDFDLGFDFDSDFSDSPKKRGGVVKRFLKGAASGAGMSIRDTQKVRQLAAAVLPRSYAPAFDLYDRADRETRLLYDRFRRGTYDGVRALQDAASSVHGDSNKYIPKSIMKQIERFAQADHSQYAPGDTAQAGQGLGGLETAGDNQVAEYLKETLLQQASLSEGQHQETLRTMNVGNAQTGMLLGIGNREMRNVAVGISRLVGFNEDFMSKAQRRSLELQYRHYNLMQGYAKLSERYMHASMEQFKTIARETAKADFEKMSASTTAKKMLREKVFTTAGRQLGGVGGLLANLVNPEWQDARIANINGQMQNVGAAASLASLGASMGGGADIISLLGQMAGSKAVDMLPVLLQMGMNSQQARQYLRQNRNVGRRVQQVNRRVNNVGNAVNYLVNNGTGIANRYLRNRTDLEEGTMSWEEYQMIFESDPRNAGRQPTRRGWIAMNARQGFLNPLINNRLRDIPIDNGQRIDIRTRKLTDLTEPAQWDGLAQRTLTEVIPGWFSRIHLSLEQIRTGRDDVQPMTYNYQRGQFVSQRNNTNLLRGQLFSRREYSNLASMSNNIVDQLDPEKKLSASARRSLSMRFLRDQDRGEGFDPILYAREEGWDGTGDKDAKELTQFIRRRFRITPELLSRANSNTLAGIRNSLVLPSGSANQLRNQIAEQVNSLRGYMPDIAEQLDILRATGNEDALRQLGIIQNVNGVDTFNNDMRWDILSKFVNDPNNRELSGNLSNDTPLPTRGNNKGRMGRGRPAPLAGFTGDLGELTTALGQLTRQLQGNNNLGLDLSPLVKEATQANTYLGELVSKTDQLLLATQELSKLQINIIRQRGGAPAAEGGGEEAQGGGRLQGLLNRVRNSNLTGQARDMLKGLTNNPALLYGAGAAGLAGLSMFSPRLGGLAAAGFAGYHAYNFLRGRARAAAGDNASDDDDIYTEDSSEPLLQSVKLKAGEYYDQISGRVITSYKFIKGAVVDASGVIVAKASELRGKLFNQRNKRIVLVNLERLKRSAIGLFNRLDPVNRLKGVRDAVVGRVQTMDVYVKGEREPRLTGAGMRSGVYLDEEGNPVTKWSEIKGTVYDQDGEVVLSEADIEKGLTNRFGVQINTLTRYARVAQRRLRRTAAKLLGGVPGLAERIRGGVNRGTDAARDALGSNGVVAAVDRVYDLLDARLPGRRGGFGNVGGTGAADSSTFDENGDGIRDNSVQDIKRKRAAKEKVTKEDRLIEAIENLRGNGQKKEAETASIFGPIMGVIGKAATAVLAGWTAIRRLGILGALKGFLTLKWLKPLAAIILGKRTREEALAHAAGDLPAGGGRNRGGKWSRRLGRVGKWGAIAAGGTALYSMFSGSAHASEASPDLGGMDGLDPALGDEQLDVGTDEGTDWGGLADDALTYGSLGAAGYGMIRRRRNNAARAASDAAGEAADLADAGRQARNTRAGGTAAKWGRRAWTGAKAAGNLVRPRVGLAAKVLGGAAKVAKGVGMAARLGRFLLPLAGGVALLGGPVTAGIVAAISIGSLAWDVGSAVYDWVKRPSKIRQLRMTMYGVDPTGKDAERIAKMEMMLKDHVTVRGGDASFTDDTPIDQALRQIITDTNDPEAVQGWVGWFTNRFKPVFLTYMAMLNKYMPNTRFEDVDKSDDVAAMYLVGSSTNDMMSHLEPMPYSIAPEAIGESPLYDEGQTSSRVAEVLKAMGKEADKHPTAVPNAVINDFGGQVTGAVDPSQRQSVAGFFSTEDNGIRRRGRNSMRPERPLDLGMNLPSLSVDASDNDVSSMLPKPGETLDELTMIRIKAYGLKKLDYAKIATLLRMEKVVEGNIARNGNALRFTGKSGDLYRLTAIQFGRNLKNQADFLEWGEWFLKRFLPVYFVYHRMVMDNVQGGLPSATYTSLNPQQRYLIGQAIVAATYKDGRAEEQAVWTIEASPFKGETSETNPDTVKLALNNLQSKAKQAEVKAPTDVATQGQAPGNSPVPAAVQQQFDEKYSFTARAPGQSKSRYQVTSANTIKDQALSGSFGANPATTGAGAYTGAGDRLPDVDKTGKVEPMAIGPGKQKGIDTVLKMAKKEGITDKKELAALLANLDHESAGFTRTEENLNYKPARLLQVFPKRIGSMDRAQQIASAGPAAIGNAVYGGRMGNDQPGDGYNYRGGGFIQLTGKDNYEAFSKATGINIVNDPDKVRKDPQTAALAALWFWKNRKGLSDAAKSGNIDKASYLINGGYNGLEDRRMKYQQYLSMFNDGVLDTDDVSTDDTKTEPSPAPGADAPSQVASSTPGSTDNSGVAGPATTASLSDPASAAPADAGSAPAAMPAPQQSSVASAMASPTGGSGGGASAPAPAPATASYDAKPLLDASGQTNNILSSIHDVLSQMLTVLQSGGSGAGNGTGVTAKPAQKNPNPANSSMNVNMDRGYS